MIGVLDGSGLLYRAKYVIENVEGSTGLVREFLRLFFKVIEEIQLSTLIVLFDYKGTPSTYRTHLYSDYKQQRHTDEHPEDTRMFKNALALLWLYLPKLGFPTICIKGYEADDIAFILTHLVYEGILITEDHDWNLSLTPQWSIYKHRLKEHFTLRDLCEKMESRDGEDARQLFLVYKSLLGDRSDNVPGVKGIGLKKALPLAQQLVRNEVDWSSKIGQKLIEHQYILERNYQLLSSYWIIDNDDIYDEILQNIRQHNENILLNTSYKNTWIDEYTKLISISDQYSKRILRQLQQKYLTIVKNITIIPL